MRLFAFSVTSPLLPVSFTETSVSPSLRGPLKDVAVHIPVILIPVAVVANFISPEWVKVTSPAELTFTPVVDPPACNAKLACDLIKKLPLLFVWAR